MTLTMYLVTLEWRRLAELAEACDSPSIARWWVASPTVRA